MGKMASNNFRARKLVHMVVNTDVCHDNSVRNTELSTNESFGLLCNETLTHSLMGSPVADFGTEDEPTTSQGLQEIENQRSNESCPDVDNAPTTSNNQILVTDSVMQNEDNEAANRLVCDALKGTTKKGTPRIRKLYTESTNTRKEAKKQKKIEKFCVKPACTTSCKKKCGEKFSESDPDLQKVIMLPRIDMFKAAIFCPRIIAFNESFVPLGPTKSTSQPFAQYGMKPYQDENKKI
ncbi:hypothetical protein HW555_005314 [Spodoptera exigua]|uniref:Uncharacterized protein n=1 Tax=Spodoptera exigua TaxID=7107 RepID=A0A835GJB4_SPOEX|nr:hypothetical protein HW555_005314 [Spodoptera exigua]